MRRSAPTTFPAPWLPLPLYGKKIDPVHPLDAKFYDEQIEEAYSQFSVMARVIGFFSFLAICIASLGLLGMVIYTTEKRLKEISIRKVLGASESMLVYLLSKGFLVLLIVAALIAIPATWLFFDKVVLVNFAYHQPISLGDIDWSGGGSCSCLFNDRLAYHENCEKQPGKSFEKGITMICNSEYLTSQTLPDQVKTNLTDLLFVFLRQWLLSSRRTIKRIDRRICLLTLRIYKIQCLSFFLFQKTFFSIVLKYRSTDIWKLFSRGSP